MSAKVHGESMESASAHSHFPHDLVRARNFFGIGSWVILFLMKEASVKTLRRMDQSKCFLGKLRIPLLG